MEKKSDLSHQDLFLKWVPLIWYSRQMSSSFEYFIDDLTKSSSSQPKYMTLA